MFIKIGDIRLEVNTIIRYEPEWYLINADPYEYAQGVRIYLVSGRDLLIKTSVEEIDTMLLSHPEGS